MFDGGLNYYIVNYLLRYYFKAHTILHNDTIAYSIGYTNVVAIGIAKYTIKSP